MMKLGRWQQIEALSRAALQRDPAERAAFLDAACAGDEALRREVESLLVSDAPTESAAAVFPAEGAAELRAEEGADSTAARVDGATDDLPADQPARKPLFFWVALMAGTVVLGMYVFAGVMIYRYGALTKDFGWQYVAQGNQWYVRAVDPQGVAAGQLQAGDQIVAINGDTRLSGVDLTFIPRLNLHVIPAGSLYTIRVARGSAEQQFELNAPLKRDSGNLGHLLSSLAVSVMFYLIGMLIGIFKPEQRVTRLASAAALVIAFQFIGVGLIPIRDFFHGFELAIYALTFPIPLFPLVLGYHFFSLFPPGVPEGRFWALLRYILYLLAVIRTVPQTLLDLLIIRNEQAAAAMLSTHYFLKVYAKVDLVFYNCIQWLALIAICGVIARNYRLVREPDQRRRIKWIVYGSVIAILPNIFAISVILRPEYRDSIARGEYPVVMTLANIATMIIPITLGYAILKHRVLDVAVVIRRSVQYLLAKNVLRIALALPVIGLVYALAANPGRTVSEVLLHNSAYFYVIALAACGLAFRRQLRAWIDRKFFHEAYSQEQILLGLIDDLKQLDSMPEISKLLSQELEAALHPQRIYVFHREQERRDLTLGYSFGGQSHESRIPEVSQLFQLMAGEDGAQELRLLQKNGLPPHEQKWLKQLAVNLVVPINGTDGRLVGLLLLGEKKSEEPYMPTDRQLLQAIAGQIAVIYENVWLKGRVDQGQKIKREVLARLDERQINLVKECPACGTCFDSVAQVCEKDQHELTLSLPVERTIDGKYRLEQLIGKGGMGAVYQATDLRLERQIAIKIMVGSMFGDRAALRRFEREARASARLNHPNIVTVYDYGAVGEGAYLAMELLHGSSLRSELKRAGCLQPPVAAEWFDQVLEGVKTAHGAGVIHRDLKPENVLVSKQEHGRVVLKILDFGLAKIRQLELAETGTLTVAGAVMGTFGYMSPEQLQGEEVDERSDIFALGVMVVEALTGKRPFNGRTYTELLTAVLREPFHLKGISKEVTSLDQALQRCLAKERAQRYATVGEMQRELIPAIHHCPSFTDPVPPDDEETNFPTA